MKITFNNTYPWKNTRKMRYKETNEAYLEFISILITTMRIDASVYHRVPNNISSIHWKPAYLS